LPLNLPNRVSNIITYLTEFILSFKSRLKANQFVFNYGRMWPFIKPFWKMALLSLIITIPIGMLDATVALFLKPYTDLVIVDKDMSSPWYIPLLIISFTFVQGLLIFSSNFLNTWVGGKFTISVKKALYSKLLSLQPAFFDTSSSGTIILRFIGDADTACSGLLHNLKNLTTRVVSSLALIGVLFYNSWHLAIVAVIVLVVAVTPLAYVKRLIKKIIAQGVILGAKMTTSYNEIFSGNRTITAYNLQKQQQERFNEQLQEGFGLSMRSTRRTAWLSPAMHFIISIGIALAVSLGSWLIVNETITAGNFVSFIAALLMLYTPIKSLGGTIVGIQASFLAIERVFEMLDLEPTIKDKENAITIDSVRRNITFENVSFSYTEERKTLQDINLQINIGESLAIVGNSGGGKSTLVSLLPRFYDVTKGSIKIDGIDIRDISLHSLRDNIGVVFQDNFLFGGTIRDNIMCGNPNATEEMLLQAVQSACLNDFISSLPLGLDTETGERGMLLSGGQKQRVAIARAFLKNAPIIVLDEATSALDNKSEKIVQQAIDNLMKDKTVFVIAHRLSTVRNADRIAVIHEGELAEIGSHEELMCITDGLYKQLYDMQFSTSTKKTLDTNTLDTDTLSVTKENGKKSEQ